MAEDGVRPPAGAEKSLGDIAGDVSAKSSLLVREEIELAKAEVTFKAKKLGAAGAVGLAAGVFVFYSVIFFFFAVAYVFIQVVNIIAWLSLLITFFILIILAAIAGLIAYRLVKRGSPPTPQMAIEEAKRTRAAIDEVRS